MSLQPLRARGGQRHGDPHASVSDGWGWALWSDRSRSTTHAAGVDSRCLQDFLGPNCNLIRCPIECERKLESFDGSEERVKLFSRGETLQSGTLFINFAVAERGTVMYSLDQGDGRRTWEALQTQLLTGDDSARVAPGDGGQVLDLMIRHAIERVQECQIPSLSVGELRVETERRDGQLWVSAVGEVGFRDSEWQQVKLKAQRPS